MALAELAPYTTTRALVGGSDAELLAVMRGDLSRDGVAEGELAHQRELRPASHRLLNSRILETALDFLNESVSGPVVEGLTKCRALVQAAHDSLADPLLRREIPVRLRMPVRPPVPIPSPPRH